MVQKPGQGIHNYKVELGLEVYYRSIRKAANKQRAVDTNKQQTSEIFGLH